VTEVEERNIKHNNASWRAQFVSCIIMPLMRFIGNLGYVFVAVVGGIMVTRNAIAIGDVTAFIQYAQQFTQPITMLANIANVIQSAMASAERIFELLDEQEEVPDATDAVVIEHPEGAVQFDHVRFGYSEDNILMEDMNIDVEPGQMIAIVGPTGAGKTTLVNLLMRFYDVNSGEIRVDGVNITHIKRGNLRRMFGMVLQDTWLFQGTIRDNIAYGRDGATEEEIVLAAKAAHADHFIRTLPDGYDTVLNEDATNISQGQKQLLTIARAILADPSYVTTETTQKAPQKTLWERFLEWLAQQFEKIFGGAFAAALKPETYRSGAPPFFTELWLEFTAFGIVLAACGFFALARRHAWLGTALFLAAAVPAIFAFCYSAEADIARY